MVLLLDFQQLGTEDFADDPTFVRAFTEVFMRAFRINKLSDGEALLKEVTEKDDNSLKDLFVQLSALCENSPRPIVLMIDEVDSAGNNQVFVDFLVKYSLLIKSDVRYEITLCQAFLCQAFLCTWARKGYMQRKLPASGARREDGSFLFDI